MKTYTSIQLLRFVAAALVVVSHTTQAIDIRLKGGDGSNYWHEGTFGVDVFFVISGFVMAATTANARATLSTAATFLIRRIIRIVPVYWAYTFAKLAIIAIVPAASTKAYPTLEHIFFSLLLIPHRDDSGEYWPVLPVGWTLCFEMFFYCAFAIALMAGRLRLTVISSAFLLVGLISIKIAPSFLDFYWNSLLLEFLIGVLIAQHRSRIEAFFLASSFANWTRLLLVVIGAAIFSFSADIPRGIGWGIPAACVLLVALSVEDRFVDGHVSSNLQRLGNASYSLYLSHTFIVPAIVVAAIRIDVHRVYLICLVSATVSIFASVLL